MPALLVMNDAFRDLISGVMYIGVNDDWERELKQRVCIGQYRL